MTAAQLAEVPGLNLSPRAKLEILFATLLALFLVALDQTIVGVALPRIVTDLHGDSLYTWAITIYLLTSTISGPIYGKLSDLFGRRPIILFAISLFIVASVLAALSQEMWQFVAARGLQGLGAGAIFPVAIATLADLYSPAERGKYAGYFGAVFGLSSILGPAVGGIITDNLGWHWIFLVNVPIGLVSLLMIWRLLPTFRSADGSRSIDYVGAALFTAAIAPFLVGLTNRQTADWTDPWVGGLIAIGLVIGVLFLLWERRVADPLIPLHLFRIRTFTISVTAMFLAAFGFFGAIVFLPRWFQVVAGASATESGYNLLPLLGALIVSATVSGQIVARTHHYKLLIVGAMITLALGLFLLTNLHADTDRPVLWIWMAIAGLGIGPSFAVFTLIVQNSVPPQEIGTASSSLTFFQQIGGTVGLTIAGTIFASRLIEEIPGQLVSAGVPQQLVDQFQSQGGSLDLTGTGDLGAAIMAQVPPQFQSFVQPYIDNIVAGIHEAFSIAVGATMWLGIAGALVAAVVVLFLKEQPLKAAYEMPAESGGDATNAEGAAPAGA
ncbi:MAG TPA: MDR family MFS transporter [Candidatus Limnocylindrales bacterium]|jgi:EmrB/QacA subfamily drug resistance transporter